MTLENLGFDVPYVRTQIEDEFIERAVDRVRKGALTAMLMGFFKQGAGNGEVNASHESIVVKRN